MNDTRLLLETLRIASPGDPGVLASRWAAADVESLLRLAEHEGAVLWLHRRLKMLGITLETEMRERITAAAKVAAARLLRLDDESWQVLTLLARAGLTVVPLRGAALRRISARVPYTDARTPADIDLLCRSSEATTARAILADAGYSEGPVRPADPVHFPAVFGAAKIGIELHLTTVEHVDPEEAWRRATCDGVTFRLDGRSIPIPGDTELLWHAMAHALQAAITAARTGTRLRFFLDAAALLASEGVTIDWERVRARIDSNEGERPAQVRAWLTAAGELAGRPVPRGALGPVPVVPLNIGRMLSWRLALLSQESGEEWSRMLFEEGARGELDLPIEPAAPDAKAYPRLQHAMMSRCARFWWSVSAV